MNLFWHNDSSTLYAGTPEQPGEMLGWCVRFGDRHREIGWNAFMVGRGMLAYSSLLNCFPDECMARQAVLDAVKEKL